MSHLDPERLILSFDLFDLPTAQHKAGLAGLLLQIRSMKKDRSVNERAIPEIEGLTRTSVSVAFTRDSLQGVFDDLYAAEKILIPVANKWAGAELKGERLVEVVDPKTGKSKQLKQYLYEVVQPQAPCLKRYMTDEEHNPWLRLWQAMIWEIPRGGNNVRSRAPFIQRADKIPCTEGTTAWDVLCDFVAKQRKSQFKVDDISGALMLGAQSVNAEAVPFSGRIDQNFLLNFWQVVVLTFVPQVVDNDGASETKGYVLAIPEVADLQEFLQSFPEVLATLDPKTRGRDYRPAAALIDIPAQANLEFLRFLRALASDKSREREWGASIVAVESFHMEKKGNNIKLLTYERIVNRPGLVAEYERIKATFRNPLFRAARLRSLLRDAPWYAGMLELFAERPWPFFVEAEKTPKYLPRFGTDARTQFKAIFKDNQHMSAAEMSEQDRLSRIIDRLVRKYVEGRAESKTGKKVKEFKTETVNGKPRRVYPKEFREAQQRVCSDAFLAMRSRHDQDFVEFFVGSICSVAQYLPADDYQLLTRILMRSSPMNATGPTPPCWEDIKALAMIAVSACSYATQPRDAKPERSPA